MISRPVSSGLKENWVLKRRKKEKRDEKGTGLGVKGEAREEARETRTLGTPLAVPIRLSPDIFHMLPGDHITPWLQTSNLEYIKNYYKSITG